MITARWVRFACVSSFVALAVGCSSESGRSEGDGKGSGAAAPPSSPVVAGLIDPNAAPEAALRAVPGLTPALAQELVGRRPFADMAAFDAWIGSHLDESARESLYRVVFIPLDLNEASREDILLIPGVGERMAHEFEEYRPYDSIERFRREIGKYVDDEEVARLERYVRISGESGGE